MDNYHFSKFCFIGKREWSAILFLALVTLVIAIMTWLQPMIGDDYFYLFVSTVEGFNYDRPVQNFSDFLESQYNHFLYVNGRAFVHFLYQFFDTLIGKWLYNLLNPLFFLAYVLLTAHYAVDRRSLPTVVMTVALIMIMPIFCAFYLWMAGSMNYLWTSVIVLIFLILLDRCEGRRIGWSSWKILLFSFVAGGMHEGITVPIAIGFMAVTLPRCWKLRNTERLWMLMVFTIGAIICALFTIHRAEADSDDFMEMLYLRLDTWLDVISGLHLFYLMLVVFVVGLLFRRKQTLKVMHNNVPWLIAILTTFAIVYVAGLSQLRPAYMIEFASLIIILRLLYAFKIARWLKKSVTCLMVVLLVGFWGILLHWSVLNRQNYCYLEKQILDGNNIVYLSDFEVPNFMDYYILDWIGWRGRDMEVFDPDSQLCIILAQTYHLDYVAFYPPKLLDDMVDKSKSFDEFTDCGYLPCYIKRKKEKEEIEKIGYVLRPATEEEKPWWVRMTGIQREEDGEIAYDAIYWVVLVENEEWIFVKKYPNLDQRLDFLEITYKESDKQ